MQKILKKMTSSTGLGQMTDREYRANLAGINIFFGAVLGFVLAGIEKLNSFQFGLVLVLLAGNVISILFISESRHRVAYSAYAIVLSFITPSVIDLVLRTTAAIPSKVVPTLVAWTLMTMLVEFWSRDPQNPDAPNS